MSVRLPSLGVQSVQSDVATSRSYAAQRHEAALAEAVVLRVRETTWYHHTTQVVTDEPVQTNHGDDIMVSEVCGRYLLPWCERAGERLEGESLAMLELARCFETDLRSVNGGPAPTGHD